MKLKHLACPLCESTGPWATPEERAAHIRGHHTADCDVCGASVNTSGLDAHMRIFHPDGRADAVDELAAPEPSAPMTTEGDTQSVEGAEVPADPAAPEVEELLDVVADGPGHDTPVTSAATGSPTSEEEVEPPEPAAPPAPTPARVKCPECGEMIRPGGLGNHRAGHRRRAADRKPRPAGRPPSRRLVDAMAGLVPAATGELIDRLAEFVAQHNPRSGDDQWLVAPLAGGRPWLCRTAAVGLVAARERTPCVVVAVDDLYAQLRLQEAHTP